MAKIIYPKQVMLFVGCIFSDKNVMQETCKLLENKYGAIHTFSEIWNFSHTNYYEKEMGNNLYKNFVSFQELIHSEDIKHVKNFSNKLEDNLQKKYKSQKRIINLDPGYLDLAKVILATTKDYTHRVYLGNGIYAEIELYYQNKTYQAWPWTYPDYKSHEYISFFLQLRQAYKKHIARQI